MGIKQTRRFRSGPLDVEILRTGTLLSLHANPRHLPAGLDPLPVGVPSDIGVANVEGVAERFSRQDHVHKHPSGLGSSLHHVKTPLFFVPTSGSDRMYIGNHTGYRINADDEIARTEVYVPLDFTSITAIEVVFVALADVANMLLDVYTDYGAVGEHYAQHSEHVAVTQTVTANIIYAVDISGAVTVLAAGDYLGVEAYRGAGGNFNGTILGVRLKWA